MVASQGCVGLAGDLLKQVIKCKWSMYCFLTDGMTLVQATLGGVGDPDPSDNDDDDAAAAPANEAADLDDAGLDSKSPSDDSCSISAASAADGPEAPPSSPWWWLLELKKLFKQVFAQLRRRDGIHNVLDKAHMAIFGYDSHSPSSQKLYRDLTQKPSSRRHLEPRHIQAISACHHPKDS